MFLSVIVPVYNSEQYLEQCLESLHEQSFDDFEVILVDDGSNDSSPAICARYLEKDSRFNLITRGMNGGASAARNTGIMQAKGEYITFLDNDDWWSGPTIVKAIHELAYEAHLPDVIMYPLGEYWGAADETSLPHIEVPEEFRANTESSESQLTYFMHEGLYYSSACAKTIRRQLILDHDIFFPENQKSNEDSDWSLRALYHINTVAWLPTAFYIWRRRSSSSQSSKSISIETLKDIDSTIERHKLVLASQKLSPFTVDLSSSFVAYVYTILLAWCFSSNNKKFRKFRKKQKGNVFLLNYTMNKKVSLVKGFYRIFGYTITGFMASRIMARENKKIDKKANGVNV